MGCSALWPRPLPASAPSNLTLESNKRLLVPPASPGPGPPRGGRPAAPPPEHCCLCRRGSRG